MTSTLQQRQRLDRRRRSRGGRRPNDTDGFAPLVLVADEDAANRDLCEAILAKLHFAVAPVDSIAQAVTVLATLVPNVIVAHARDVSPLQRAAWPSAVPFVTVTDEMRDPDTLAFAIRQAIRTARTPDA